MLPIVKMRPPRSSETLGLIDLCMYLHNQGGINVIAEIGTYTGESAHIFSNFFLQIFTVDMHKPNAEDRNNAQVITQMQEVKALYDLRRRIFLANVIHYDLTSVEGSKQFADASLDFVYIDANHSYEAVKEDIAIWRPKVRAGGFIGGHDYAPEHRGVMLAVNELQKTVNELPVFFKDNSWLIKIR